ncbi:MAG: hypothetical protein PHQ52_07210, partial [Candidatus Omnitrophica bacterium]|nr:hypothetical protein [Candidatus Omnitrophota bacterium]
DLIDIRTCVDKYEQAYSEKNVKSMIDCCDIDSEWFKGFEDSMTKEFARYEYIRLKSTEKKLARDPNGTKEDDLITIRRSLYIAYIDNAAPNVGNRTNNSASINEFNGVYYIGRSSKDQKWKIRKFGQMPCDEQIAYLSGKQMVLRGKVYDAITEYKKSISINPSYSPAYSGLSDISFAMGKLDDATYYAKKAVELQPDVAYYRYSLAMLYLYSKDKTKGLEELKEVKKLDKEFPDIDYFLKNADKVMSVSDYVLNNYAINEDRAKIVAIDISNSGDGVKIEDLNLTLQKPKGWIFAPRVDWYTIFSVSTVENPSLTDPLITVNVRAVKGDNDAAGINLDIAKNMAVTYNNNSLVKIGASQEVTIAGLPGTENGFVLSDNLVPVVAIITTLIKGKIAYSIVYSDKAKDMKINELPYKEIIAGFQFIDPKIDVSEEMVANLIAAEKG